MTAHSEASAGVVRYQAFVYIHLRKRRALAHFIFERRTLFILEQRGTGWVLLVELRPFGRGRCVAQQWPCGAASLLPLPQRIAAMADVAECVERADAGETRELLL